MFKETELDIVIQSNMKTVNYLHVTPNLENSTYRPYQKENNEIFNDLLPHTKIPQTNQDTNINSSTKQI